MQDTAMASADLSVKSTKMEAAQGEMTHLNSRLRAAVSDLESFADRMLGGAPSDQPDTADPNKPNGALHELISSQGYCRHLVERLEHQIGRLSEIA